MKLQEAQARAVAEHGELALIAVDASQAVTQERITLRPPMLQVVRLASFQHAPSVPPFLSLPKQSKVGGDESAIPKEMEERKVNEVAVGGGGVSVAATRFPAEQKRPVGPLIVVGVRDGVLWLIDRYMCAHAISLSHPGIRCRCLAAYGDAVSAVKWASRLGREHHDDLAQFMLGMGYATEALHLPGISKRLEFDLAMQSNDLKRALQCLLTMSNSRDIGQETVGLDLNDILSLTDKKENIVDAVQGVVKFANEFLELIDAADATAQGEIAREAIKRLAAAGSVKGALRGQELRGLALRLANHGELTRLSNLVNNMISVGSGREAAFAAAVLGDNTLMEKAWQETGMLAEAVLHAHAHGRPTLRNLVQAWNKMLQKEMEHTPSTKTDAAAAFLASLEGPKLTSLADAAKKLPIEILPPGMASLYAPNPGPKKPGSAAQGQQPGKPMLLEAPPADTAAAAAADTAAATATATSAPPPSEPSGPPPSESSAPPPSDLSASVPSESGAPPPSESSAPAASELSAPTTDDQTPSSSVGVMDLIVPAATTSSQAMPEAPNPAPDIQGTNGPATAPMIDFS
ncbi:SH3 domain-binding protein 1-like [Camellia sinensis]|nr:SH3 domain-binding protein 1-like [Camellia sinensis]